MTSPLPPPSFRARASGRATPAHFAWLSVGAAVLTIGSKSTAYVMTGSVGLLSEALESGVNLVAAFITLGMLTIAARPPDDDHEFGHDKAEYFASGAEGVLVVLAAVAIGAASYGHLARPATLVLSPLGLGLSVFGSLVNLLVARLLFAAGRRHGSIALEADAQHLMADVWTSAAVLVGVGAAVATRWPPLDALIGLSIAVHILWSGAKLLRRSVLGLLDTTLPTEERAVLRRVLESYAPRGARYHALRTRQSGGRRFVNVHVLVPGDWTVKQGHDLLEALEADLRAALGRVVVLTHLEPIEDPASWDDVELDREPSSRSPESLALEARMATEARWVGPGSARQ